MSGIRIVNAIITTVVVCALALYVISSCQLAGVVAAGDDVCWGDGASRQCVPLSIVKSTFQGYQPGGPSPVSAVRQDLISVQSQLAETLKNFRQCEGTLGPLQADAHGKLLQQQLQQLESDNVRAAPPGTVWDGKAGKYVPAPVSPPSPSTPPPATTGRGVSDRR